MLGDAWGLKGPLVLSVEGGRVGLGHGRNLAPGPACLLKTQAGVRRWSARRAAQRHVAEGFLPQHGCPPAGVPCRATRLQPICWQVV